MAEPMLTLQERSFQFALRVLKVVDALPRTTAGYVLGRQLARSGTSIGANSEEAKAGHSRAEFARRLNIAQAEAPETLYWLRLIEGSGLLPKKRLASITDDAESLVRLFTAAVRTARKTGV